MIFVNTGAWYATVVETDQDHASAVQWSSRKSALLITTDYIIDETLTLLRARRHVQRAMMLGEQLFSGAYARIHYLTPADIELAWQTFRLFSDKDWSFTDCTSRVVIESLHIKRVLTFDRHFAEFGLTAIEP